MAKSLSPGSTPYYQCDSCSRIFLDKSSAVEHEQVKHGMHGASPKRKNACRVCGKRFRDGAALQAHMSNAYGVIR